jgi:thiosulfate reductase cytochrome b subunit
VCRLDATAHGVCLLNYHTHHHTIMIPGIKRAILRWIHIVLGVPIIGYVYSPFEEIPNYAPAVRFVFLPALVLTGLWMWKGHVVRRLMSRRST